MRNRVSTVWVLVVVGLILFGNLFIGGLVSASNSTQDSRSLRWDRYDVTIDNVVTADNRFDVTESYQLTIEQGPFSFGTAEIPTDRLKSINSVHVYDGGHELSPACNDFPGTVCVSTLGNNLSIEYHFLSPAYSGEQRTIQIKYTVYGALRSYTGGDQLYWVAVPGDRYFPALASRVMVTMPADRPAQKTASYPDTWIETTQGSTIIWDSPGSLGNHGSVEVRIQYPHDPSMKKPSWQAGYDREQAYKDNIRPFVSLGLIGLSIFLLLGGIAFVYLTYVRTGRDPQAVVAPEYLSEPPSDELPGIVGALVDEKADMQDILATLVDLGRREYLVIEQAKSEGVLGLFASDDFRFHRTDKSDSDLTGYEQTLLRGLFPGGAKETSLADLRTKFYRYIPAIKRQMYTELVNKGYFKRSPESTRNTWMFGGIGIMALAAFLFWVALSVTVISPVIMCPPVALGMVGAFAAVAASYMPAKTQKGSQEAARWRAFRTYLGNIKHYADLTQVAGQFDRYLPFAVAFGMQEHLTRDFVPVLTAMPGWYFPTYVGGPWVGGYRGQPVPYRGGGAGMGKVDLGGPGGLNDMSRSLTEGLNSLSGGLTQMLNDASRVMTSKPSSSSGGHGGFSGGGSFGGGGSGGGSRGFG